MRPRVKHIQIYIKNNKTMRPRVKHIQIYIKNTT